MITWADTPAGRFQLAGDVQLREQFREEFRHAETEEIRMAAKREFDLAHRPGAPELATAPWSTEERQRVLAADRAAIYARGNWFRGDDKAIEERIRLMGVAQDGDQVMGNAQSYGPPEPNPAYIEAQNRMRGVPGAS